MAMSSAKDVQKVERHNERGIPLARDRGTAGRPRYQNQRRESNEDRGASSVGLAVKLKISTRRPRNEQGPGSHTGGGA